MEVKRKAKVGDKIKVLKTVHLLGGLSSFQKGDIKVVKIVGNTGIVYEHPGAIYPCDYIVVEENPPNKY